MNMLKDQCGGACPVSHTAAVMDNEFQTSILGSLKKMDVLLNSMSKEQNNNVTRNSVSHTVPDDC